MNKGGSTLTLAIALLAVATPVAQGRPHRGHLRSCAPRENVVVLASNPHAEIYERLTENASSGQYGCMRRGGPAVYLGVAPSYEGPDCLRKEEGHCVRVREQMLSGTTVAYLTSPVEPGYTGEQAIVVRSLATARVLHRITIHVRTVQRTMLEWAEVRQLFARPDGAIAWVQEDSFARHGGAAAPPPAYSIFVVDRNGFRALTPELPASPRSLMLAGSRLYWTNEGAPESAAIE